jgi:glycine reductase
MKIAKRAICYINQFYAGIGGEEKADIGLNIFEGAKGPGIGLEKLWNNEIIIEKTICCGDNFINNAENFRKVWPEIKKLVAEIEPDIFIAGPAFNAGRYGVACAKICTEIQREFNIPAVTAMNSENPAVPMFVKDIYIIETSETAAGMKIALEKLAPFVLKLSKRLKIGPARKEGYLPRGYRYNEINDKIGAERVVDLLLRKLKDEKYSTEIPLREFNKVKPAEPLKSVEDSIIALITTGGLVPKSNPDKLKSAFSISFGRYNIKNLDSLKNGGYESIHGGHDTSFVNEDPNRLVPLDELKKLQKEGHIKEVYKEFFTTCGVGTNVENSKKIGREIAKILTSNQINAAILTST